MSEPQTSADQPVDEEQSDSSSLAKPEISPGDSINGYELSKELGRGQFATVWLGRKETQVGAVKVFTTDEEYVEIFTREINALTKLQEHPNIIKLVETGEETFKDSPIQFMVVERMSCDLFTALRVRGAMRPSTALRTFAQICNALDHCHKNRIAHADLKPENVLCDHSGRIVLTDFGGSVCIDETGAWVESGYTEEEIHVTDDYRAPETILDDEYFAASDMWAAGCLLFEVATATTLFPVLDEEFDADDEEDAVEAPAPAPETDEVPRAEVDDRETTPVAIEAPAPALALGIDSDDDNDSDFSLSEAVDELTQHQATVSQLAAIVRVLGPVTKSQAKKNSEIFTPEGYVDGFSDDKPDNLRDLLIAPTQMLMRDASIIEGILKRVLKYNPKQRITPAAALTMRALREFS